MSLRPSFRVFQTYRERGVTANTRCKIRQFSDGVVRKTLIVSGKFCEDYRGFSYRKRGATEAAPLEIRLVLSGDGYFFFAVSALWRPSAELNEERMLGP